MATTFKQDMPPKGGYPSFDYKRALPKRGLSGYMTFAACAGVMSFGLYMFGMSNRQRRLWAREQKECYFGLMPLLKAEDDRYILKALQANFEQEAIIMRDIPDWKVGESVYETKRWMHPMISDLYYLHPKRVRDNELYGYMSKV